MKKKLKVRTETGVSGESQVSVRERISISRSEMKYWREAGIKTENENMDDWGGSDADDNGDVKNISEQEEALRNVIQPFAPLGKK